MTHPAHSAYQKTTIMTAGRVKSVELLLEKLKREVPKIDLDPSDPNSEQVIKCQNIVAQLEMSLNFEGSSAPELFDIYETIYMGLSAPTHKSIRVVQYLITNLLETLKILSHSC